MVPPVGEAVSRLMGASSSALQAVVVIPQDVFLQQGAQNLTGPSSAAC